MGKTIIKTVGVESEALESNGAVIYRYGRVRDLWLPRGAWNSYWILSIPEKDRPIHNISAFASVYNGTSYVDCIITLFGRNDTNAGRVYLTDMYGGTISNADLDFLNPHSLIYIV